MPTSPTPWRISDGHGLCIVDAESRIVADFTPRHDWMEIPSQEVLRANAERIVELANGALR